jgi:hypothetical protein
MKPVKQEAFEGVFHPFLCTKANLSIEEILNKSSPWQAKNIQTVK